MSRTDTQRPGVGDIRREGLASAHGGSGPNCGDVCTGVGPSHGGERFEGGGLLGWHGTCELVALTRQFALLLIALAPWAPPWVRIVGAAAAIPFAAHALIFLGGGAIDSTGPLAGIGYALLTVTIVGWIVQVRRDGAPVPTGRS